MFLAFWLVYSKKFVYTLEPAAETGGLLHWRALHQLFTGVYTAELCLVGLFFLQGSFGQGVSMAFILLATVLAQYLVLRGYSPLIRRYSVNHEDGQSDRRQPASASDARPCEE